jgi:site-specific DNA recombinase
LKSGNLLLRYKAEHFIEILSNSESIERFDMDLYFRIVEKMVVFKGEKVVVTLLERPGIESII